MELTTTEALLAKVEEIRLSKREQPRKVTTIEVVQLPLWPEPVRAIPNVALRSALFAAVKKRGAQPYLERQVIQAQGGITITYTGARLDQIDLSIWLTIIHLVREHALGAVIKLTAYQILKALGKSDTGKNRAILNRRLSRMNATALDIRVDHYSYEGSLIDEIYRDPVTHEYVIKLNAKLQSLFAHDQFTKIEWSVRRDLDGKPLAQWLHGYYASHATPYPLKLETLHKLCGSEAASLTDFKKDVRRSLDEVQQVSEQHGQFFAYSFQGSLVSVVRQPTC